MPCSVACFPAFVLSPLFRVTARQQSGVFSICFIFCLRAFSPWCVVRLPPAAPRTQPRCVNEGQCCLLVCVDNVSSFVRCFSSSRSCSFIFVRTRHLASTCHKLAPKRRKRSVSGSSWRCSCPHPGLGGLLLWPKCSYPHLAVACPACCSFSAVACCALLAASTMLAPALSARC